MVTNSIKPDFFKQDSDFQVERPFCQPIPTEMYLFPENESGDFIQKTLDSTHALLTQISSDSESVEKLKIFFTQLGITNKNWLSFCEQFPEQKNQVLDYAMDIAALLIERAEKNIADISPETKDVSLFDAISFLSPIAVAKGKDGVVFGITAGNYHHGQGTRPWIYENPQHPLNPGEKLYAELMQIVTYPIEFGNYYAVESGIENNPNLIIPEQETLQISPFGYSENSELEYEWHQLQGPEVSWTNKTGLNPYFATPQVYRDEEIIFSVRIKNKNGSLREEKRVSLTIKNNQNEAPELLSRSLYVLPGEEASLTITARDPNNDQLHYQIECTSNPQAVFTTENTDDGSVVIKIDRLAEKNSFSYAFIVTVDDARGGTISQEYHVFFLENFSEIKFEDGALIPH